MARLINAPNELAYRIKAVLYVRAGWFDVEGAVFPALRTYAPGDQ